MNIFAASGRIKELETELKNLRESMESSGDTADLQSRITGLETELATANSALAALQAEKTTLETASTASTAEVARLNAEVTRLQTENTRLSSEEHLTAQLNDRVASALAAMGKDGGVDTENNSGDGPTPKIDNGLKGFSRTKAFLNAKYPHKVGAK